MRVAGVDVEVPGTSIVILVSDDAYIGLSRVTNDGT